MKKSKKAQTHFQKPSWRAIAVITWMVFMTAAVGLALLWSWGSIKLAGNAHIMDWPRQVRKGMEDTYRHPIISADEKLFVLPELNIALPYEDAFARLRYSSHVGEDYQEATLTTSDIIVASTQPAGTPDDTAFTNMPFFTCSLVLTIFTQESEDYGVLLDSFELADGRTLYAYTQDKNGADCDAVYADLGVDDFLNLVSRARPYNL